MLNMAGIHSVLASSSDSGWRCGSGQVINRKISQGG